MCQNWPIKSRNNFYIAENTIVSVTKPVCLPDREFNTYAEWTCTVTFSDGEIVCLANQFRDGHGWRIAMTYVGDRRETCFTHHSKPTKEDIDYCLESKFFEPVTYALFLMARHLADYVQIWEV